MKTTILLMFSFIIMTGSLLGQKTNFDYIDSDVKGEIVKTKPFKPYLKTPKNNSIPKFYGPTLFKLDSTRLYQDSALIRIDTIKQYSDVIVPETFPGSSRYYAKIPNLSSSLSEKSFILSPNTALKHYLIIVDPNLHTITK